jgi:hypothetical protein
MAALFPLYISYDIPKKHIQKRKLLSYQAGSIYFHLLLPKFKSEIFMYITGI